MFREQLYKNNARALLPCILSFLISDWLQHARSVGGVYEWDLTVPSHHLEVGGENDSVCLQTVLTLSLSCPLLNELTGPTWRLTKLSSPLSIGAIAPVLPPPCAKVQLRHYDSSTTGLILECPHSLCMESWLIGRVQLQMGRGEGRKH